MSQMFPETRFLFPDSTQTFAVIDHQETVKEKAQDKGQHLSLVLIEHT